MKYRYTTLKDESVMSSLGELKLDSQGFVTNQDELGLTDEEMETLPGILNDEDFPISEYPLEAIAPDPAPVSNESEDGTHENKGVGDQVLTDFMSDDKPVSSMTPISDASLSAGIQGSAPVTNPASGADPSPEAQPGQAAGTLTNSTAPIPDGTPLGAAKSENEDGSVTAMGDGSPTTLGDGSIAPTDPENPNAAPLTDEEKKALEDEAAQKEYLAKLDDIVGELLTNPDNLNTQGNVDMQKLNEATVKAGLGKVTGIERDASVERVKKQ